MCGQRLGLVIVHTRFGGRVGSLICGFNEADPQPIGLVGGGCCFFVGYGYFFWGRPYLQRATLGNVGGRGGAIGRYRCAFGLATRVDVAKDVSGVSFCSFVVGEYVFKGGNGSTLTFGVV